jgi:hypothetical protein
LISHWQADDNKETGLELNKDGTAIYNASLHWLFVSAARILVCDGCIQPQEALLLVKRACVIEK